MHMSRGARLHSAVPWKAREARGRRRHDWLCWEQRRKQLERRLGKVSYESLGKEQDEPQSPLVLHLEGKP